ncbi:integral peroxisomal membrane peroxin [Diplocarpon rosae]|nr:integral peroxisomal membrane peroxin [Diplocarpon rosae]
MDEYTFDAFANRDDPIPVISFNSRDSLSDAADDGDNVADDRKGDHIRRHGKHLKENVKKGYQKASSAGPGMQDRLLEKLLQQVIPIEDLPSSRAEASPTSDFISRPSFSLPTMSTNFRRFNARIGVVFVFQAKAIRLLSWNTPTHTFSFLAIYTFICLDPYLLAVLPFAILLLALLIPAFIARHPAPPPTITTLSSHTVAFGYNAAGPPLAPAPTVKPVKELSKDFFRNMRDLQNCMEDFSRVHDQLITLLTPPTNFSNEPLSSTVFLFAFFAALFLFIASHLLPWRIIFLVLGWAATCSGHPTIQRQLLTTHKQHVAPRGEEAKSYLDSWIARDIVLDSAPETREVEIFELQRLSSAGEWESWLFSSSPYDPLSEPRIRAERPKGTRFFEDVQPPQGWEWSEKKWALDLWSREWVEERIITSVEVETEGERWVYDIRYEYNDEDSVHGGVDVVNAKGKKRILPSWEEGGEAASESEWRGRRGEWRRRRWVRMVKRRWVPRRSVSEGGR